MNLPFFIAKRYLVSKKKQNIINIISGISVLGMVVGTAALVIILSVFNGFTSLIDSFYSDFDPDLKITAAEGKMFDPTDFPSIKIKNIPGVVQYEKVIEEVAMLKYGNQQYFATVKGIPDNYNSLVDIDSLITEGTFTIKDKGINYAVVGAGIASNLSISTKFLEPIHIYVPKKGKQVSINLAKAINHNYVFPGGIFSVLEDVDSKYILVPYEFAADLFESGNKISAIELRLEKNANKKKIQKEIETILGETFHVKNKYQQHDFIYKTMKSEKWVAYLILIFILVIASFNILSSLSMLIIDKKDDILILRSMGASSKLIRYIFLFEGWLISVLGAFLGAFLGLLTCWLQITFEIITFPANGSFIVSAYPVKIIFTDIVLIIAVVLLIGFIAAWYPLKFISKKYLLQENM